MFCLQHKDFLFTVLEEEKKKENILHIEEVGIFK